MIHFIIPPKLDKVIVTLLLSSVVVQFKGKACDDDVVDLTSVMNLTMMMKAQIFYHHGS